MANKKSITTLITELQEENERLNSLGKLFEKAVKNEFGYGTKELHQIIEKWNALARQTAAKQGNQPTVSQRENVG
ncbi:hypothetical protein [Pseudobutyrivibrio sp.]|uniref:hypothetical protein n=1 Tax=Pseudobutyrivibrio sp. TaxID=2014367 RepID=UPI001B61585E|nr:hypothetical protein [Pseudobutyrivibrio sp.]MBP3261505.1 hypothetical protein [Pseudobutyrivibrio sp.]